MQIQMEILSSFFSLSFRFVSAIPRHVVLIAYEESL